MKSTAMARPHHRKKHKEHLQQFKHRNDPVTSGKAKSKGSGVFAIVGAIFGLGISYVATSGSVLWMMIGTVAGLIVGYYIGKMIDQGKA